MLLSQPDLRTANIRTVFASPRKTPKITQVRSEVPGKTAMYRPAEPAFSII